MARPPGFPGDGIAPLPNNFSPVRTVRMRAAAASAALAPVTVQGLAVDVAIKGIVAAAWARVTFPSDWSNVAGTAWTRKRC